MSQASGRCYKLNFLLSERLALNLYLHKKTSKYVGIAYKIPKANKYDKYYFSGLCCIQHLIQ